MIHRWKDFDLEITDLIISMIRHPQLKLYHLKSQTLKHIYTLKKFQKNLYMVHLWKVFDLEITDFNFHHGPTASGETIPSQASKP